jgi:hypothetical protein
MPAKIVETETSQLFERRMRYHQGEGRRGADLFLALAGDPELPSHMDEPTIAAILNVLPATLKARRRKQMPPPFTYLLGRKKPHYGTPGVCYMLAGNTCEGRNRE